MKKLFIILIGILTFGCATNKPDRFPVGLEAICLQQMEAAKQGIINCGTPLKKKNHIEVYLQKGEQKINGMWCWGVGNYWVGGYIDSYGKMFVGCNPVTMGEVSTGVLFHEFGHYWLISNYGIRGHDPKYDSVFHWTGLGMLHVQTNKMFYHYDEPYFFKTEK